MSPWASVKEKEALRRASEMARGIVFKAIWASELSLFSKLHFSLTFILIIHSSIIPLRVSTVQPEHPQKQTEKLFWTVCDASLLQN